MFQCLWNSVRQQIDHAIKSDFNTSAAFRDAAKGAGAPAAWIVDEKEAAAATEQANQQAAMQQAVGMAGGAGMAAKAAGEGIQAIQGAANPPNAGIGPV